MFHVRIPSPSRAVRYPYADPGAAFAGHAGDADARHAGERRREPPFSGMFGRYATAAIRDEPGTVPFHPREDNDA